jgi:hypothetical protein
MPDASPMTIKELSGDKREIRLVGRALPYRPFTLTTEQRVELDWYPGLGSAVAQVLGPKEPPTSMNGYWKDKYLGDVTDTFPLQLNNGGVLTCQVAADLMDSFVLMGQLVVVRWLNATRRGFVTQFEKKWHNEHDLEWVMKFDWVDRGDQPGPAVFATTVQLGDVASRMRAANDALGNLRPPNFGLLGSFIAGIQKFQHSIEDLVNNIEDAVQNFTNQVSTVVRATRGVIATLRGLEGECRDMRDFLNAQVAGWMNKETDTDHQTFSQGLTAEDFRRELLDWANEIMRKAVEQRTSLSGQVSSDVMAVAYAVAGQDLRDISRIYYGTSLEWRRIMIFNDLYSIALTPGELVFVPKLNQAQVGQQSPGN